MTQPGSSHSTETGPGTESETVGINREPVSTWLASTVDGATPPFTFELLAGGRSNLTYRVTGADGGRLVLRRPPLGAVLATAHDMAREHKILTGIAQTDVPAPVPLALCTDETVNGAPFYVMSHVDGVVLHDDVTARAELGDRAARQALSQRVVEVLARLHRAEPDAIGLGDLSRRRDGYLERQLRRWKSQWESSRTRPVPAMDDAFEQLAAARPDQRHTGVVHGDYRLGNLLVDPAAATVAAVLDWELCALGDVLADVGYLLNSWAQPGDSGALDAAPPPTTDGGFSTREELIDAYTTATGFEVTDVAYYQAFQHWRLAVIAEGVYSRYQQGVMGTAPGAVDAFPARVEAMAAEALRLLATR